MKRVAVMVAALAATGLLLPEGWGQIVRVAQAHGPYSDLRTKDGKQSCCNDRDCRPAKFKITGAGVRMLVAGRWLSIPERVIQYRSLPSDTTEGGHWCGHGLSIGRPVTVCAILPPNSAEAPKPPPRLAVISAGASK